MSAILELDPSDSLKPGLLHGVYSYREAARLLSVTTQRVTRWADGYVFAVKSGYARSAPILQTARNKGVLSFDELIELFFVREYVALDVSLPHIRATAESLARELGPYPFSRAKLIVSGRELIVQTADRILQRPDVGQLVADFALTLCSDLEFRVEAAARYFPPGFDKRVFLDKEIRAGEPVVTRFAVPTRSIFHLWELEKELDCVADYFDISPEDVSTAIRYEGQWRLAA